MAAVKSVVSSLLLTLPLCLGLSACSSGPGEEEFAPQIHEIYSEIAHRHPSFYEKWPNSPQRSIDFTVSVIVSDPQGIENLLRIYVTDLNDNYHWSLFDANEVNAYSRCFRGNSLSGNSSLFECQFYPGNHPDYSNLQNFEVVIQDLSGYTRRKAFNFLLAGGEQPDQKNFVYSDQFSGNTTSGYVALETMTLADNNLAFSADMGAQSFQVEFTLSDSRASHYSLEFYDNDSPANYVGSVSLDSSSIESHPIIFGQTTQADIPFSEIEFEDGFSVADIKHMHITLYDSPIPWIINGNDEGLWFNHLSTSEIVSLP